MRLWHQELINKLPRQQLLGQHRECCALRGLGWGKKHSTVDYVFIYELERLIAFHFLVMKEMEARGYQPSRDWKKSLYRGKTLGFVPQEEIDDELILKLLLQKEHLYLEHNGEYLKTCLENLRRKGIVLDLEHKIVSN